MRLLLLISLSLALLTGLTASAQLAPADDFFHSGAQAYITNNVAQAKEVVAMGRKLYPEDEKLKKLEELLNQKQQQQQQNQDQQQQNQQDKSEQQKSEDKKNQQQKPQDQKDQKPDEQKPEDKKDQSPDQKKDDLQPKPDPQKDSPDKPKDEEPKPGEGQPVKAGQMTPDEAKRLLDAQKGNEQLLQLKPQEKPKHPSRTIKDW
jgi:Ca-activated chloride channel family protein